MPRGFRGQYTDGLAQAKWQHNLRHDKFSEPSFYDVVEQSLGDQYIQGLLGQTGALPNETDLYQQTKMLQQQTQAEDFLMGQKVQRSAEADRLKSLQNRADRDYERGVEFFMDPANGASEEEYQQFLDAHAQQYGGPRQAANPVQFRKVAEESDNRELRTANAAKSLSTMFPGMSPETFTPFIQPDKDGNIDLEKAVNAMTKWQESRKPNPAAISGVLSTATKQLTALRKNPALYDQDTGMRKPEPSLGFFGGGQAEVDAWRAADMQEQALLQQQEQYSQMQRSLVSPPPTNPTVPLPTAPAAPNAPATQAVANSTGFAISDFVNPSPDDQKIMADARARARETRQPVPVTVRRPDGSTLVIYANP